MNYELCELLRAEISELIVRRIKINILYYDTNSQLFYNTPRAFIICVTRVTIISMVWPKKLKHNIFYLKSGWRSKYEHFLNFHSVLKNHLKKSWKIVHVKAIKCKTPSILTIFFKENSIKNSWNFVYIQATQCITPFYLTNYSQEIIFSFNFQWHFMTWTLISLKTILVIYTLDTCMHSSLL